MRVFARYAAKETGSNLIRNPIMTIAAIVTIFISLFLFGASLYMRQAASQASIVWQQETRLTVWMNSNATAGELSNVKTELASSPYVQQPCTYWGKARNYEEAKRLLAPYVFQTLHEDNMYTSFICTPKIPTDVTILTSTFSSQPGVNQVTAPYQAIKDQEHAINLAQIIVFVVAIVLLTSAMVLIWNTIRLAIFARRRELSVMKLVGATNWFIRIPYIFEGFVQGLIGSLLASAVVFTGQLIPLGPKYQISIRDVVGIDIVVLLVGLAIGSLGAGVAIRRFLDV